MAWNGALHPRAAAGTSAGGQFTAGGSKSKGTAKAAPAKTAAAKPKKPAKLTFAQQKALRAAHAKGAKLTPDQAHQLHLAHVAHVAHEKHLAALKAKATVKAKPKTTPKPKAAPKATMTVGQKAKAMATVRSGR